MSNTVIVRMLNDEIKTRSEELDALISARDVIANAKAAPTARAQAETPRRKKTRKAMKRKAAKRSTPATRAANGEPDTYGATFGNIFIPLSLRMSQVFDTINAAPEGETVPIAAIAALYDGNVASARSAITQLKAKLRTAKATIGNVRGQGYRLESL